MLNIKHWRRKHKMIGLIILFLTLCYIILFVTAWKNKSLVLLTEISDDEVYSISDERLIFFVETTRQVTDGVIRIKPRQACALESAARIHPEHTIYLLYTTPKEYENSPMYMNISDSIQSELLKYENLKIKRFDLDKCAKNTPYEEWFKKDEMKNSKWPREHTSDVMRFWTMWKYGGIYMDLDFVLMKNLEALGSNYMVAGSKTDPSSGILNFRRNGIGHDFAENCIMEVTKFFNCKVWGFNGPLLVGRVLNKFCNTTEILKMDEKTCQGMKVLEPWHVYPIDCEYWFHFFDSTRTEEVLEKIKPSYAIHLWNKLSQTAVINTQEDEVAYGAVANKYCPNVYRSSGIYF